MNGKHISIALLLATFIALIVPCSIDQVEAITIHPGNYFQIGNENYTVASAIEFSYIAYTATWIRFNDTDFNISSASDINITLSYVSDNMADTTPGDILLTFTATCPSGLTSFNMSGFVPAGEYDVYRSGSLYTTVTATATGNILFSNNAWSTRQFQIRYHTGGYVPVTNETTNYLVTIIIPLLVAVSLLILLVALFFTGAIDIKSLIMWMVMAVIAIAVVMSII